MRRSLALLALVLVEAIVLHLVWCTFCLWVGELDFPALSGRPDLFFEFPRSISSALALYAVPVGVSLATAAFIAPLAPPMRLARGGRSLRSSVIGAAFVGGGLVLGVGFVLLDLPQRATGQGIEFFSSELNFVLAFFAVLGISWAAWTAVLWRYENRSDHSAAARMLRVILAGSLIELAIAVPAYAYMRSKESCWCGLGTFWALACGVAGLFFVAGPGALLIWYRRTGRWIGRGERRCGACGYPRAPGAGRVCPECGGEWLAGATKLERRATDGI